MSFNWGNITNTTSQAYNNAMQSYNQSAPTYNGGSLNGSTVTAQATNAASSYLNKNWGVQPGTGSKQIGGQTVYGKTSSTSDFKGKTYNDLSEAEKQQMLNEDNGGGSGSGFGSILMNAGPGINAATTLFGKQYSDEGFQDEQTAINIAGMFGPWGALGGAIAGVSSQVTRAADINTSKMSERAREAAGVSKTARFGNNMLSWLNNQTWGLYSGFGAIDKINDFSVSRESDQLSGAYSGTLANMRAAEDVAGSRFFFGKSKLNNLVNESIKNDQLLNQIGIDNEQRVSSVPYNAQNIASRNFRTMNGMTGQSYATRVGKEGMKMLSRQELDKIYAAKKIEESDITKLQNGGSILVPEGALHAHKHHMEEVNPDLAEDLTKKGIPVVAVDEKGEVTQVAEIEKQELIFEKSLTEEIEKLWKDNSEEAMIKAGKLITKTLMTNCDDNAGLVKEVE